jgi:hydrogenase maturation protease
MHHVRVEARVSTHGHSARKIVVKKMLVLGVGNLLMGDEGIGVHAAKRLEEIIEDATADVLDGGTGGFHLLGLFQDYDPIILIDATMDGKPAGTVTVLQPRFASDFPRTLSAHDIGLRDLLESAQLLAPLPQLHLITISIESIQSLSMELSDDVKAAIDNVLTTVKNIISHSASRPELKS